MAGLKNNFRHLATQIENRVDRFKRPQRLGPMTILPYLGHGTAKMLHLKGRVIADYRVVSPLETDSGWKNLWNNYRRFHTHEIPNVRIHAYFGDMTQEFVANDDGYFEIHMQLTQELAGDQFWHEVGIELADDPAVKATGKVLIPPTQIQYGVISDLDDTVIKSDVVQVTKLLTNTFLRNSRTRLPFAGVAAFYHALQQGTVGGFNPIYYVTSGIWNLYDVYLDFLQIQGIPIGPIFMTDLGLTEEYLFKPGRFEHKLGVIRTLLETHPQLPFILIGDSGEKDAEIYGQIAIENPGRVRAIYIRDVSRKRRDAEMQSIIQTVQAEGKGTEILLVPDTIAAATHAIERGYILPETLPAILEAHRKDTPPPNPVESLRKSAKAKH
ncbi:MAG: DUF2183 domain-containing protein [Chloroflexi bacterium]|nr:DUF2183 domain-containing protein [Chloroflexota bacterium]